MLSDSAFLCAFRGQKHPYRPKNSLEKIEFPYHCPPFPWFQILWIASKNNANLTFGCWKKIINKFRGGLGDTNIPSSRAPVGAKNILQVLVFTAKSGGSFNKRHIIHSLTSPFVVSVYFYICLVGNAAFRRQLQFPGGPSDIEFRHDNQCSSHGVPGI